MANGQQMPDWFSTQSGVPSGAPALLSGQFGINQNTATGLMYYWDLFTTAWVAFGGGGSGFAPTFVSKTANYTILTTDTGILGDATGGSIVLTLPTAVGSTAIYFLMKKDSGANTVTIATTSSQTINGASTVVLSAQNAGIIVLSDNANWRIVAQVPATGGSSTITSVDAQLSSNVALSSSSLTDVLSISLAAGDYVVWGTATLISGGTADCTVQIYDGTNGLAASSSTISSTFAATLSTQTKRFTLGSTTTIKLRVANVNGGSVHAAAQAGSGNIATGIVALKVG